MWLKTNQTVSFRNSCRYVLAVLFLVFVIDCGEAVPQQAVITIDPKQKFQTMTGWEATTQAGEDHSPAFNQYKDRLFESVVNELGINRLRIEIRSGAENPTDYFSMFAAKRISEQDWLKHAYEVFNDNDDPLSTDLSKLQFSEIDSNIEKVVLPIRRLLAKRGERLFVTLTFVDFNGGKLGNSDIRHSENPEEYAELIVSVFKHMDKAYGFVPDAIEVVLEPDNDTGWTGTQMADAIVSTAKRLKQYGFEAGFIVPSTVNAANAPVYFDEIAKNNEALKHVTEFSYHRYTGASVAVLRRIRERAIKYKKSTGMLEYIGADHENLHEDLKAGLVSSWQQYTLAFPNQPDNGAQYFRIDDKNPDAPVLTMASRSRFLRQYFRWVRFGAQRVGAESRNPAFDPVAFINKGGDFVLIVKASAPGSAIINGLPDGNYRISYTTRTEYGVESGPIKAVSGKPLIATIPAPGVITVYASEERNSESDSR